ncbi:MAG: hypothetical protein A3E26_01945 [Chlamydiae bacterium RIFCSPHIGHO2_12_FULL_49_32]|nr:MAG: hypothetical protein A3E26_01945 [Chlamydiae bacterium RIFCSPHIGHO2_12_FULL_49_32]
MSAITVQGVQFFNSATSCIDQFENTSRTYKIYSYIQSFGTFFAYLFDKVALIWHRVETQMASFTRAPSEGFSKQRLIVCMHGLNNNPVQFKKIFDEMQKRDLSETNVYIPYILQKGNAKLDDMVRPIFAEIVKWAQNQDKKELVLVGISNGGRIAQAIEAELIKSDQMTNLSQLRVVSIVGACRGSILVDLLHRLHLSWLLSRNIAEEMSTDSSRNKQLDQDFATGSSKSVNLKCTYTRIASPHDWQVPNYNSTLIETPKHPALYAIVPGHGHNSIVNAVAKAVVERIF